MDPKDQSRTFFKFSKFIDLIVIIFFKFYSLFSPTNIKIVFLLLPQYTQAEICKVAIV